MPNYGDLPSGVGATGQAATSLEPGNSLALFNNETPNPPQASIAFRRAPGRTDDDQGVTFSIAFAAAATDSLLIQGSNQDIDAQYQTLYTSTNKQFDLYTDIGRWAFYRAKLASQAAGGAVTVIAQR